jgi:hypothetical protein
MLLEGDLRLPGSSMRAVRLAVGKGFERSMLEEQERW